MPRWNAQESSKYPAKVTLVCSPALCKCLSFPGRLFAEAYMLVPSDIESAAWSLSIFFCLCCIFVYLCFPFDFWFYESFESVPAAWDSSIRIAFWTIRPTDKYLLMSRTLDSRSFRIFHPQDVCSHLMLPSNSKFKARQTCFTSYKFYIVRDFSQRMPCTLYVLSCRGFTSYRTSSCAFSLVAVSTAIDRLFTKLNMKTSVCLVWTSLTRTFALCVLILCITR